MKHISILHLFLFLALTAQSQNNPKHEMRAVWIATVLNIDWPSAKGLPVDVQKKELTELLDLAQQYHMNTVVFQIRPAADALYFSSIEPWSEWLTGEQGRAPEPFYDPLEFAVQECRMRGLDIHVWFNPYRAVKDTLKSSVAENHITKTHPEWFVTYGGTGYFDPALPQTRDYVSRVVSDVVRRYDIDAVHMDDYFYPYRISNLEFPDDSSFATRPRGYSADQRDDWRRENVDLVIKQIHDSIKAIKPWVEFGISPFGVWRNIAKDSLGSNTRAGQTNYDDLFADIIKWQKEGWIDYVTPQIYWYIGFDLADYAILCDWWSDNANGTQLYIGQAPYRIRKDSKDKSWRNSKEIVKQIRLNREHSNIAGSMFFSAKVLRSNPLKLQQKLTKKVYRYQALPPDNTRIRKIVPEVPAEALIESNDEEIYLKWEKGNDTKNFVIYKFRKGKSVDLFDPKNIFKVTAETNLTIPIHKNTRPKKYYYVITAQSQTNTESKAVPFK